MVLFAANQQSKTPQLRGDKLDRVEGEPDLWDRPSTSSATTYEEDPGPLDSDDPAKLIEKYSEIIHRDNYEYTIQKVYNFPFKNRQVTYEDIDEQLRSIYGDEQQVFKIKTSLEAETCARETETSA